MTIKEFIAEGLKPEDHDQFIMWLRMEVAKMVSEADVRHLVHTSFDNSLAAGIKNAIVRHVFTEWELE